MPHDPLARFVDAQASCYTRVIRELSQGRKQSHWMWYIFPQIHGLGVSETARFYAIASLAEARAYLAHPVLGSRLEECTTLVITNSHSSLEVIFGHPDDMKFHSSMTLFARAAPGASIYSRALQRFWSSHEDPNTLTRLAADH